MDKTLAYFRHFGTPPRLARKLRGVGTSALLLDRLLAELRRRGIQKQEVAKAAGIAPASLSRVLQKRDMELSTFLLLVEAAGLTIEMKARAEPKTDEAVAVLERLRECEPALRRAGIDSIAIFGSLADGTAQDTSDIDILISTQASTAEYRAIDDAVAEALQGLQATCQQRRIDIAFREKLKPELALEIKRTAIYAF